MSLKSLGVLVCLLACQAGAALASNLNFLRDDAPITRFNQKDMQLMQDALDKAMNAEPGTKVEWANDKSGASGSITQLGRFERAGAECRKAEFTTRYKTIRGGGEYNFCKTAQGIWQLVQ
ncbi:hypothetical protein GCM10027034_00440 [Ramlibacter solisilvae]|uniref:Surface antigen domain-containing protein n=1 Tax=Ramlibacter tataouinensis TaxID=94132 RepID=A0A127JPC3_9BURK|nr:RT0821/Lpp0805 family surface protein [Ramlibacter tataouinensis]AMO21827.1 hypothetical protein UC35_01710 [Ramlibacter tataouinensis]